MPSSNARKAKGERASSELFENVTNPFCGTLPDDLTVERTDKGLKVAQERLRQVGRRFRAQAAAGQPRRSKVRMSISTRRSRKRPS